MTSQPKYISLLKDKKAVILGGTSGIGFSLASALIEEGAHVVVASSRQERVDDAVKRLTDPKQQFNADQSRVQGKVVNLKGRESEGSLKQLFDSVGPIDHLIHTAGDSLSVGALDDVTYDKIIDAGQVRYFSALLAAKAARPHLRKGGSIVFTTGSIAELPLPNWPVVAGFAGALVSLTRQLAYDLSNYDLRVNVVGPGPVATELWDGLPADAREGLFKQSAAKALTGRVPGPEEVVQTYLGLLKDANITGQAIYSESGHAFGPRPPASQ